MKNLTLILFLLFGCLTTNAQSIVENPENIPFYANHPWRGKRVAYIGDSITDPKNSGSKLKYWNFLQQWLNIEYFVPAKSGRQWNDVNRQMDLVKNEWGDDFNAVFIFLGTNDFFSNVKLGEWYTCRREKVMTGHGKKKSMEMRKHRVLNMDDKTLRGRINIALSCLKKDYPTKQIVLLTPIHRAGFYHSDTNWQPTEEYANELGFFVDDYVQAVKEAGNVWAVPVIDLNALSGLYPLEDNHGELYFKSSASDRLHPNDNGHLRMAYAIAAALSGIAIW